MNRLARMLRRLLLPTSAAVILVLALASCVPEPPVAAPSSSVTRGPVPVRPPAPPPTPPAARPPHGTATQWAALSYLGVVSMFLGFFAWYRGLAIGPMAQVSQVQLVQPVLTICWAGLLLGEHLGLATILGGLAVIACAGGAVRVRLSGSGART